MKSPKSRRGKTLVQTLLLAGASCLPAAQADSEITPPKGWRTHDDFQEPMELIISSQEGDKSISVGKIPFEPGTHEGEKNAMEILAEMAKESHLKKGWAIKSQTTQGENPPTVVMHFTTKNTSNQTISCVTYCILIDPDLYIVRALYEGEEKLNSTNQPEMAAAIKSLKITPQHTKTNSHE
jgi:hypothetical protein